MLLERQYAPSTTENPSTTMYIDKALIWKIVQNATRRQHRMCRVQLELAVIAFFGPTHSSICPVGVDATPAPFASIPTILNACCKRPALGSGTLISWTMITMPGTECSRIRKGGGLIVHPASRNAADIC